MNVQQFTVVETSFCLFGDRATVELAHISILSTESRREM